MQTLHNYPPALPLGPVSPQRASLRRLLREAAGLAGDRALLLPPRSRGDGRGRGHAGGTPHWAAPGFEPRAAIHCPLGVLASQVHRRRAAGRAARRQGQLHAQRPRLRRRTRAVMPSSSAASRRRKVLKTLLAAWRRLKTPLPLKIVGDGPLAGQVRAAAASDSRIDFLGRRSSEEVLRPAGRCRSACSCRRFGMKTVPKR